MTENKSGPGMSTPARLTPTSPSDRVEADRTTRQRQDPLYVLVDHARAAAARVQPEASWLALSADDPRLVAALASAAAAWFDHCSVERVEADLRDELVQGERAFRDRFVAASHDVAAGVDWRELAERPTLDQLRRLRSGEGP